MTPPKKTAEDNSVPANENNEPAEEGAVPSETDAKENVETHPLQERMAALEAEAAKFRDQWMRAVAEADNIRKRAERDQMETSKYAITAFARDMVHVLENLKRASESVPEDKRKDNDLLKTIGEGVDLTLQEMLSIFERFGIKRIDPLNQKFDHNFHQAVVQIERTDVPPGTIVQVVQAGYVIGDRLLRPAMVAVSKGAGDAPKQVDTTA